MTFFEKEMKELLSKDTLLTNVVYNDKMAIGQLNKNVVVKISFETGIYADHYYGVLVKIINKEAGVIDSNFFNFNNTINSDDNKNFYIWHSSKSGTDWYSDRPTATQKNEFMKVIYSYIKLYQ